MRDSNGLAGMEEGLGLLIVLALESRACELSVYGTKNGCCPHGQRAPVEKVDPMAGRCSSYSRHVYGDSDRTCCRRAGSWYSAVYVPDIDHRRTFWLLGYS